jgi:signal transduction histidine kinase
MVASGSLRSKLIVSHLAVIGLVFVLTVLVASVPVRRAQQRAEEFRLSNVAETVAIQTDFVTRPNAIGVGQAAMQGLLARQANRSNTSILVADSTGRIVYDSDSNSAYDGDQISGLERQIVLLRERARQQALAAPAGRGLAPQSMVQTIAEIDGRQAVVATTTDSLDRDDPLYPVVLSTSARLPVLDRYLRPLLFAAGIAVLAGVGASMLLARSIARPITRLTETAGAINAGNLDVRAEGAGDDELGRLVRAFNAMIDRLATTYASQRGLLANIAHELRTPLTSIQGYAQALRDGVLHDAGEREAALVAIREESERVDDLVNQILQLSRLESGQLPLRPSSLDRASAFYRLRRRLSTRAAESAIELHIESDDNLRLVADEDLLAQALGNLATNAIRHSPAGGLVSMCATRVVSPGGDAAVRIRVSDSGTGIPAEELPYIFDRFYRGGSSAAFGGPSGPEVTARRFGLGLAIAREIVARHGGTIAVESTLGRGTTFTLDLPVGSEEQDEHASRTTERG